MSLTAEGVNPNSGDSDEGTATGRGPGMAVNHPNVHEHLHVNNLHGAHVVQCGSVALTSGTPSQATVTFPTVLEGSASDYLVIAVPVGATAAIAAAGVAVSALSTSSFVLTGPNTVTTTIYWILVKIK